MKNIVEKEPKEKCMVTVKTGSAQYVGRAMFIGEYLCMHVCLYFYCIKARGFHSG